MPIAEETKQTEIGVVGEIVVEVAAAVEESIDDSGLDLMGSIGGIMKKQKDKEEELLDETIFLNVPWNEFIPMLENNTQVKIINDDSILTGSGIYLDPLQSLFLVNFGSFWRLAISTKQHLLPYSSSHNITIQSTNGHGKPIDKGVLINLEPKDEKKKDSNGLLVFMPYESRMKLYAFYVRDKERPRLIRPYAVGSIKHDIPIPTISRPKVKYRALSEKLTENDIVRITNASTKFGKVVGGCITLGEIFEEIFQTFSKSTDPNYFTKIMELSMALSYPTLVSEGLIEGVAEVVEDEEPVVESATTPAPGLREL